MAPQKQTPAITWHYLPLDNLSRDPMGFDDQGNVVYRKANGNDMPWILTSMVPEAMGPAENPDDFLPTQLKEDKLDGKTLAEYKARSGEPWARNNLVNENLLPLLGTPEDDKVRVATKLNKRDQDWRTERGILTSNFKPERREKGGMNIQTPKQVIKAARQHSDAQWLHRTWGVIIRNQKCMYYICEGTQYALRAPMDLPPRLVELFKAANMPIPRVRTYIENNHDIWAFFFPDHYRQTKELRRTYPSAALPIPGYILDEYQGEEEDEEAEGAQEEVDDQYSLTDAPLEDTHDFWDCFEIGCSMCYQILEKFEPNIDPNLRIDLNFMIDAESLKHS